MVSLVKIPRNASREGEAPAELRRAFDNRFQERPCESLALSIRMQQTRDRLKDELFNAMNAETFCQHFATFAEPPNGVAKLREMILQLAGAA